MKKKINDIVEISLQKDGRIFENKCVSVVQVKDVFGIINM